MSDLGGTELEANAEATQTKVAASTATPGLRGAPSLAARAARMVLSRPRLTVAVLVLASVAYASSIAADEFYWRYCARMSRQAYARALAVSWGGHESSAAKHARPKGPTPEQIRQRTLDPYYLSRIVWSPLQGFARPLDEPAGVADGWVSCLRRFAPSITHFHQAPLLLALYFEVTHLWTQVPALVISTLLLVGLLGWMRDSRRPLLIADWPRYWVDHYIAVLLIAMVFTLLTAVVSVAGNYLVLAKFDQWGLDQQAGLPAAGRALLTGAQVTIAALALAFMLAPFAVVRRRLGVWRGIVEGMQLLRRHWLAVILVFVIYRAAYELPLLGGRVPPLLSSSIPARALPAVVHVLAQWVQWMALALLGLWVAHAFMEIAKGSEATTARSGTSAQGDVVSPFPG